MLFKKELKQITQVDSSVFTFFFFKVLTNNKILKDIQKKEDKKQDPIIHQMSSEA